MYVSRSQWGAQPPKGTPHHVAIQDRKEVVFHYSTGEELGRDDCYAWVREIQAFHQGPQRGWDDIGYNELVCKHGDVFEGRGRDIVGAHCPNHNTSGIGICFLGNDGPEMDVTEAARATLRARWLAHQASAGHALPAHCHRDYKATLCPGDELYLWVKVGLPLDNQPIEVPPPPVETRPTIQKGSTGKDVMDWQFYIQDSTGQVLAWDGIFGDATVAATINFQKFFKLTPDGIVGPVTWRTMDAVRAAQHGG